MGFPRINTRDVLGFVAIIMFIGACGGIAALNGCEYVLEHFEINYRP